MADPPDDDPYFVPDFELTPEEKARYEAEEKARAKENVVPLRPRQRRQRPPPQEPKPPRAPKPLTPDEQAALRSFVELHEHDLKYNHDIKRWFIWGEHRWREDRTQHVLSMVLDFCNALEGKGPHRRIRFAVTLELAARAHRAFATSHAHWDRNPWLLGTPGGVVELKTGKLRDGRPADMISKTASVTPAETADCPKWRRFIAEALGGDDDNIAYLHRFFGYALTGLTKEESLLFIAGKPGTGKGTATKTILGIFGDYGRPLPSTMFTTSGGYSAEYYRAQLADVRLILASEPEKGARWNDALVNELTGGDQITGRVIAGQPFRFAPLFKLVFQGEQLPDLKSVATGLRRRLGILPFEVAPDVPDQNLKEDLRDEGPGILRLLIEGCQDWRQRGLDPPPAVNAAVADYFAMQDRVTRWVDDCCLLTATFRTKPSELRASFNAWADKNGEDRMSFSEFHQALKHAGFKQTAVMGVNFVHGLAIRS